MIKEYDMIKEWVVEAMWTKTTDALASIDGWTLEAIGTYASGSGHASDEYRYVSLIKHECYPGGRGAPVGQVVCQVVCYPEDSGKCWRCEETIPDMMTVLWNFQNWEKIQHRRGYE